MSAVAAAAERVVCRLEDIPDGGALGFDPPPGRFIGAFAVRRGAAVFAYLNACPHLGVPLDIVPNRFLDARGRHIRCATHGALFRIADGHCLKGPCAGGRLTPIPARVEDGAVLIGPTPD